MIVLTAWPQHIAELVQLSCSAGNQTACENVEIMQAAPAVEEPVGG